MALFEETQRLADAEKRAALIRQIPVGEIKRALRAQSRGVAKEPCFVCGKHQEIAELHHVVSVEEITRVIKTYGLAQVPNVTVWLCPNHHTLWHWFQKYAGTDEALDNEDLTDEVVSLFGALEERGRVEFWERLFGDE